MEKGSDFWLCNSIKTVDGIKTVVNCHAAYHVDMKLYETTTTGSVSVSTVVSELTDE